MNIKLDVQIKISLDTGRMLPVPQEKIEQVVGQIITRFSRWESLTMLHICTDGNRGDIIANGWRNDTILFTLGAVWRKENNEYTFHS